MSLTTDYFKQFAKSCIQRASQVADSIQLSANRSADRYMKASAGSLSVEDDDRFVALETFYGMKAWAVILSVDIRKSSQRAVLLGARGTYVTMHTVLPTMAEAVRLSEGKVIGLRGDGLIACFGLVESAPDGGYVTSKESIGAAVQAASRCGKAMIEAIDDAVEPALDDAGVKSPKETGRLQVGVGIDLGEVVVTKIGLLDAQEVTAYGPPVDWACKHSNGNGEIRVSPAVDNNFPTGHGGKVKLLWADGYLRIEWPSRVLQ